jgi:hypothetical protein
MTGPTHLPRGDCRYCGLEEVGYMNKLKKTAVTLAMLFAAQSAFACDYPQRIDVPNGTTASKEDMIAGQKSVKSYMSSMEEYLACIEGDEAQAVLSLGDIDESAKRQRADLFNKKYNAAVEEMNLVAEEFNVQVRAYKDQSR